MIRSSGLLRFLCNDATLDIRKMCMSYLVWFELSRKFNSDQYPIHLGSRIAGPNLVPRALSGTKPQKGLRTSLRRTLFLWEECPVVQRQDMCVPTWTGLHGQERLSRRYTFQGWSPTLTSSFSRRPGYCLHRLHPVLPSPSTWDRSSRKGVRPLI